MKKILAFIAAVLTAAARGLWRHAMDTMGRRAHVPRQDSSTLRRLNLWQAWDSSCNLGATGPATVMQAGSFDVADHIRTIRLDPPIGVLYLRVYSGAEEIRPELIVHEPRLRQILQARRIALPTVTYRARDSLAEVGDTLVKAVEALINERGRSRTGASEKAADQRPKRGADLPAGERQAPAPAAQVAAPLPAPAVTAAPETAIQAARTPFVPDVQGGTTYTGVLVDAGAEMVKAANRPPYEIFVARLRLANGAILPLRGAELERELLRAGAKVGQQIAVTPQGKVPVDLGDGKTGHKNLYRVEVVQ